MTQQQRQQRLDELTRMVLEDFGEAPDNDPFNPFSPADVARQAVIMLQAAYQDFEEIDEIADKVLTGSKLDGYESDNLSLPGV